MTTRRAAVLVCTAVLSLPALASTTASAAASGPCAEPTIVGTADRDRLRGTPGPDVIVGLGGDDSLMGLGGDDVLCGGAGADHLVGGAGDDALHGGRDRNLGVDGFYGDTLAGGPGDDLLDVGADARSTRPSDVLTFESSRSGVVVDLATGTASGDGEDRVRGEVAQVLGSAHDDRITGTPGDEELVGDLGSDVLLGGPGTDTLLAGDRRGEHEDAGTTNLLDGGAGRDVLQGAEGDDTLLGRTGPDVLHGDFGADHLDGGRGRDLLDDHTVPDREQSVDGGPGRDRLYFLAFFDQDVDGSGFDAVGVMDLRTGLTRATYDEDRTTEVVCTGFEVVGIPSGRSWTVRGTDAAEVFENRAQSVRLYAAGGDDVLEGGPRADLLDGGAGFDRARGHGGRDRYVSVERRDD